MSLDKCTGGYGDVRRSSRSSFVEMADMYVYARRDDPPYARHPSLSETASLHARGSSLRKFLICRGARSVSGGCAAMRVMQLA
jgi:hypothetical protein